MRIASIAALLLIGTGCFKTVKPSVVVAPEAVGTPFAHADFEAALSGNVTEEGRIDYGAIQKARQPLHSYVGALAAVSPNSHPGHFPNKDAELAYWINAYNALAITGILDRPEMKSVIDQKVEYFYKTKYVLGDEKVNLYSLENQIVRPYGDPRIHFALNCMSGGCPLFPEGPFTADRLEEQLERETIRFVNHPEKVRKGADGVWEVSSIFDWYGEDFEAAGGVAAFIHGYRDEVPADATVRFIPYDWSLIAQEGTWP